jgi:hypothetical protein
MGENENWLLPFGKFTWTAFISIPMRVLHDITLKLLQTTTLSYTSPRDSLYFF